MIKPRIRMIIPIWGTTYIERWLDLCFATLRAEGNISYLNENSDFELAILTMKEDVAFFRTDPRFNAVTEGIRIRFVVMDEFFPVHGKTPYGVPLTLAYAKGIQDMGEAAIGAYVILLNADVVVSAGSLKSVLDRIEQGYDIVAVTGIRTEDGDVRKWLQDRVDKERWILSVAPREMMEAANENLHSTITSRTLNDATPIDCNYFHQMYWRISEDCIATRSFLIHPLCFRIDRPIGKVLCPVDYGFITELCPSGRICVLDDSDDFMVLELQAINSEGYQLRLAKTGETADQRLARLATEIGAHAATWTTSAHRRFAKHTVFFHSKDLPDDVAERVAPFEAFVDGILDGLPPPVSHIKHFQWLPAVYYYRQDMIRGGGDPNIALLDDPRNDMPPHAVPLQADTPPDEATTSSEVPSEQIGTAVNWANRLRRALPPRLLNATRIVVRQLRSWRHDLHLSPHRNRLAKMVMSRVEASGGDLEVVFIDHINNHVKSPPVGARIIDLGNAREGKGSKDFSVAIPPQPDGRCSEAAVIYAPAGILASWNQLAHDAKAILASHKQLVLVLIHPDYVPIAVSGHSYILSILQSCFPCRRYGVTIDRYLPPEKPAGLKSTVALLARTVVHSLGGNRQPFPPEPDDDTRDLFSALVISAKQRPSTGQG